MRCRIAVLALVGLAAGAAVAPRYSLEDLVDRSPRIVEGSVTRSWTAWDAKHKYIWTHYEIRIAAAIRGPAGTVTVSEPGGSLDGQNQGFSGALPYSAGERVVLFLFRTPLGYWRTTGGGQGKFTVAADGSVRANTQGLEYAGTSGAGGGTPLSALKGMRAGEFRVLVRKMVRERAVRREAQ